MTDGSPSPSRAFSVHQRTQARRRHVLKWNLRSVHVRVRLQKAVLTRLYGTLPRCLKKTI